MTYDELLARLKDLQNRGLLSKSPTRGERVSWVLGNVGMSNPDVTREMVERAVVEDDNRRLREKWERQDAKQCKKGKHETFWPVFADLEMGGIVGWHCHCGKVEEKLP